jgi:hypothetical protein
VCGFIETMLEEEPVDPTRVVFGKIARTIVQLRKLDCRARRLRGNSPRLPDQDVSPCTERGNRRRVVLGAVLLRTVQNAQGRQVDDGRQALAENPCDEIIDLAA